MRAIIGDQQRFAIEYEIQPSVSHVMGTVRLWLEGQYLGAIQDKNILSAISCQLGSLSPEFHENAAFLNKSASDVFDLVYSEEHLEAGVHCFTPGEAFDDFSIVAFFHDGAFYFIWKLDDDPHFAYPGYPKGFQTARVSIDEYRRVVGLFKEAIEKAWPEQSRGKSPRVTD